MKRNCLKRLTALSAVIALLASMTACADTPGGDESTTTAAEEVAATTNDTADTKDFEEESEVEAGTDGEQETGDLGDESETTKGQEPDSGDDVVDELITNKDGFIVDEDGNVQLPFIPVPTN